jgi:RNA polymerase sigma-70 factor (ECF subfamily)
LLKPPKNPVNFPASGKSDLKQVGQPIPTGGDHPDDTALLAQVVRGSEDALVALHRRYVNLVFSLTRHAAIDRLRQECRQPSRVSISQEKDPYSTLEHMNPKDNPHPEAHQALRIALEQLPLDQRTVIDLAYFGGMSQQDIAESLRLPLGTVKTRIRLGMQHLRAMWNHHP